MDWTRIGKIILLDKSFFVNTRKVITSKERKSKEITPDKDRKKVQDYFENMLDTFESEERINKSSGRPFNEFKEEYLASRKK
jgi:hypothetical protein